MANNGDIQPTSRSLVLKFCFFLFCCLAIGMTFAELQSEEFYRRSCPKAYEIIEQKVAAAVQKNPRVPALLLRLHFHDCFVNGCDASILLNFPENTSEKTVLPNKNSAGGFELIEDIKDDIEKECPETVSCADILALAARDATVSAQGPTWKVRLNRTDSLTGHRGNVSEIPAPSLTLDKLMDNFKAKNFSTREMVVLSGAHTLGFAQCQNFRNRINNSATPIDTGFNNTIVKVCPVKGGNDTALFPLDSRTPLVFDSDYYQNLIRDKGVLLSDQRLHKNAAPLPGQNVNDLVKYFATNQGAFFEEFSNAMTKMGTLTGKDTRGEIRIRCNTPNNN